MICCDAVVIQCRTFFYKNHEEIMKIFTQNFEINDNVDQFYTIKYNLCEKVTFKGCMRPQDKPKVDQCECESSVVHSVLHVQSLT